MENPQIKISRSRKGNVPPPHSRPPSGGLIQEEKLKILVVACHADDEILGCGGTIIKHIEKGDQVDVLIVTSPSDYMWDEKFRRKQLEEQKEVDRYLGTKRHFLNYPSTNLTIEKEAEVNYKIFQIIDKINPDIIYTHCETDMHNQHNIVGHAVLIACRIPKKTTILQFEIEGNRGFGNPFIPNYYVSLTGHQIERKIELFKLYKSEVKRGSHPRSAEGLLTTAEYRGQEIGVEYAEAFRIVRIIK